MILILPCLARLPLPCLQQVVTMNMLTSRYMTYFNLTRTAILQVPGIMQPEHIFGYAEQ